MRQQPAASARNGTYGHRLKYSLMVVALLVVPYLYYALKMYDMLVCLAEHG
jgi:hypothetical protein